MCRRPDWLRFRPTGAIALHELVCGSRPVWRQAGRTAVWQKRGYELGLGCGIAQGYATLGQIGFDGGWDYAAIGGVTNLAARLCAEAAAGQMLLDRKIMARVEGLVRRGGNRCARTEGPDTSGSGVCAVGAAGLISGDPRRGLVQLGVAEP